MDKKIAAAIVVLTLLGVGAFVYEKKRDHFPVSYLPYETSPDVVATTTVATSTLDYTKLEKDTIYTEEGGEYENLSEGEKNLLAQVVSSGCSNPQEECPLYGKEALPSSSIISLYKGYMLLSTAREYKPSMYYVLYDLAKKQIVPNGWLVVPNPGTRNDNIIILVDANSPLDLNYYRPGMNGIKKITSLEKGTIKEGEFYGTDWSGSIWTKTFGSIKNDTFTIDVNSFDAKTNTYKKVREITIDLNTLE